MTLGEKLVHLRKGLGLSQLEAAEKLNVSRQAISRWEVGAAVPSVDNLKYLSELYGVPVPGGRASSGGSRSRRKRRRSRSILRSPAPEGEDGRLRPSPPRRWRLGLRLVCLWGWVPHRIQKSRMMLPLKSCNRTKSS